MSDKELEKFTEGKKEATEELEETKGKKPKYAIRESVSDLVKRVNEVLYKGEPGNVSVDTYTKYTGYKPQFIIDAMTAVFGIGGWGFRDVSMELVEDGEARLMVANEEVWIAGIDFRPTAYGQSRVTRGDIGDAKKGAQTDAIKKALSYFSIGNRAYHGLLKGSNQSVS